MAINDSTLIHDSLLILRAICASGTTDPISATRSANSQFITLKGSRRPKEFPVVVLDCVSTTADALGQQSENMELSLTFRADIQSSSVGYDAKGVDWVYDDVFNALRTNQRGTSPQSGTQSHGLYDFRLLNVFNIDEPGPKGLHRRVMTFQYKYWTTS